MLCNEAGTVSVILADALLVTTGYWCPLLSQHLNGLLQVVTCVKLPIQACFMLRSISGGNAIKSTRKATEVAQLMIRSAYLLMKQMHIYVCF